MGTGQVQQQYINHGVQRLAMMTGRIPPSQDMLLFAILQRISLLPKALLRKYQLEGVHSDFASRSRNEFQTRSEGIPIEYAFHIPL
jgi:hypothetical protein